MSDYIEYVRDQLQRLGGFTIRPMFGGHGLFWQGTMFALVSDDSLYLRTDDRNRGDFEQRGLMPFKPWADRRVVLKSYYPLPEDVLEDPDEAVVWARRAVDAALASARRRVSNDMPAKSRPPRARRGEARSVPTARVRRARGDA